MSNAGYGNHDAPPPDAESKTPGAAKTEVPEDGTNAAPSSAPAAAAERRDASTPGEGALSDGAQGDDVDPGVG